MKTIGIIGGLGPPSTVKYYEQLNEGVNSALGGQNNAKIILTSVNGEDVKNLRLAEDQDAEGAFYAKEAKRLEDAGADFILIASNTSHKNAPYIEDAVSIPLLHLANATGEHIRKQGMKRVLLLATALTMEEDFYKSRLVDCGLEVLIPNKTDRQYISNTIYNELVKGIVKPQVNGKFEEIIGKFDDEKIDCVILGCTELTLLDIKTSVPQFDTVKVHVDAALEYALS